LFTKFAAKKINAHLRIKTKISYSGGNLEQFCEQMTKWVINTVFWGETLSDPIKINYYSKFSSNNVSQ